MSLLTIDNQSTRPEAVTYIPQIVTAVQRQLRHVAREWGEVVWHIYGEGVANGYRIVLLDDADVPGALGYHDIDDQGQPFAKIFVNTVLNNGGTWTTGPISVSCVVSHEVLEMVGDPLANLWSDDLQGTSWAHELCDAVESDAYTIKLPHGVAVAVSNFVTPNYFNPLAPAGTLVDYLGLLKTPFEIGPGGYAIRMTNGKQGQVFNDPTKGLMESAAYIQWGDEVPAWKRTSKLAAGRMPERLAQKEVKE